MEQVPTVSRDIYNYGVRLNSAIERIKNDANIIEGNRTLILRFIQSREAMDLSTARVCKYACHMIVIGRFARKAFEEMSKDDVEKLILRNKAKSMGKDRERVRVSYDLSSDILYLLFKEGPSEEVIEAGPDVMLEMDKKGNVMGLEMWNAKKNGLVKKLAGIAAQ